MKWDSDEWRQDRDLRLLTWFGGDRAALEFLYSISKITELWDDLIDKDKPITPEQINDAMFDALITLPCNPFYTRHATYLAPIMIAAISSWQDANTLAKGTRSQKALAYTLRNMDVQVIMAIITILRGRDKARELGPAIWTYLAAEQDDFDAWMAGDTQ